MTWIQEWERCNLPYESYEIWEKHWLEENPEDRELDIYELIAKYSKDKRIQRKASRVKELKQ